MSAANRPADHRDQTAKPISPSHWLATTRSAASLSESIGLPISSNESHVTDSTSQVTARPRASQSSRGDELVLESPATNRPTSGMTNQKLPNAEPTSPAGCVASWIAKLALHSPATIPRAPSSGLRRSPTTIAMPMTDIAHATESQPATGSWSVPTTATTTHAPAARIPKKPPEAQREDAEPHSPAHPDLQACRVSRARAKPPEPGAALPFRRGIRLPQHCGSRSRLSSSPL